MMKWCALALALLVSSALAQTPGPPGASVTTVGSGAPSQALPMLQSTALEASHIFKTSPGNLYSLNVTNTAAAGFLLLIDGTTAPTGALTSCGTANANPCLKACLSLALGTSSAPVTTALILQPGPPISFVNGIVAEYSTTGCNTSTLGTAADFFQAQVY